MPQRAASIVAWLGVLLWWQAPALSRVQVSWQVLAWIPDAAWMIAISVPALTAAGLACLLGRRRVAWAATGLLAILPPAAGALARDVGWNLAGPDDPVRLIFLQAQGSLAPTAEPVARSLIAREADLVVVSDPNQLARVWRRLAGESTEAGAAPWEVQHVRSVMTASRWGPCRLRTVVSNPDRTGIRVVEVTLPDRLASRAGVERLLVVDLPSDPTLDRDAVADTLQRALAESGRGLLDEHRLVLGDFNMTPRDPALVGLRGSMRDLVVEGGRGWLATWPRERPLLRIDQAFGDLDGPVRVEVFDPAAGGHRGLQVEWEAREPGDQS